MIYNSTQIAEVLKSIPNWELKNEVLYQQLTFKTFTQAFAFMVLVAFEAEKVQHHPNWTNVYNKLTIELTTHDEGGITKKDIELATCINKLLQNGF